MASQAELNRQVSRLQAENQKLKAELKRLKGDGASQSDSPRTKRRPLRWFGMVFFVSLAVALAIVGNLLFWFGNTAVKTDRFVEAVSPVIENSEVQSAVSQYATDKFFQNVDTEQVITEALPPRAEFLATPLSGQLHTHAQSQLQRILASPKFHVKWDEALQKAHGRFITAATNYGSDGVIDISEVYQRLSEELKQTRLSFLADKPLPDKIGSIQVVSGPWLATTENVAANIDTWRTLAIVLLLLSIFASVWLSRNRRKSVIRLGFFIALGMLFTLIALRIATEMAVDNVQPAYAAGAEQAVKIILNPLFVQTRTLLVLFLLVAFVAWISGPSRNATAIKSRISDLFAGRLHHALFGDSRPGFSVWLGRYKRQIEWLIVALIALALLFVRITPMVLLGWTLLLLFLIILIETLASEK